MRSWTWKSFLYDRNRLKQIHVRCILLICKKLHPIAPNEHLNRLCNSSTWSFWPIDIAYMLSLIHI